MAKLVDELHGTVHDCAIVFNPNHENQLRAIFFDDGVWKNFPLNNFKPAVEGVDY